MKAVSVEVNQYYFLVWKQRTQQSMASEGDYLENDKVDF